MIVTIIIGGIIHGGLRNEYIDKYRNNEIVQTVSYKYKVIDGEKQVVDNTYDYVRNK